MSDCCSAAFQLHAISFAVCIKKSASELITATEGLVHRALLKMANNQLSTASSHIWPSVLSTYNKMKSHLATAAR